jgi:hypothetical protein
MGFWTEFLDNVTQDLVNRRGFEDGIEGKPPYDGFKGRNRGLYFRAYRRGQKAAKVRLQNAMVVRLKQKTERLPAVERKRLGSHYNHRQIRGGR